MKRFLSLLLCLSIFAKLSSYHTTTVHADPTTEQEKTQNYIATHYPGFTDLRFVRSYFYLKLIIQERITKADLNDLMDFIQRHSEGKIKKIDRAAKRSSICAYIWLNNNWDHNLVNEWIDKKYPKTAENIAEPDDIQHNDTVTEILRKEKHQENLAIREYISAHTAGFTDPSLINSYCYLNSNIKKNLNLRDLNDLMSFIQNHSEGKIAKVDREARRNTICAYIWLNNNWDHNLVNEWIDKKYPKTAENTAKPDVLRDDAKTTRIAYTRLPSINHFIGKIPTQPDHVITKEITPRQRIDIPPTSTRFHANTITELSSHYTLTSTYETNRLEIPKISTAVKYYLV